MYPIATAATSVQARGASKLSACCAATRIAAIAPSIAQNSVVRNEAFVSSRVTVGWDVDLNVSKRRSSVVMSRVAMELPSLVVSYLCAQARRDVTGKACASNPRPMWISSQRDDSTFRARGGVDRHAWTRKLARRVYAQG